MVLGPFRAVFSTQGWGSLCPSAEPLGLRASDIFQGRHVNQRKKVGSLSRALFCFEACPSIWNDPSARRYPWASFGVPKSPLELFCFGLSFFQLRPNGPSRTLLIRDISILLSLQHDPGPGTMRCPWALTLYLIPFSYNFITIIMIHDDLSWSLMMY